MWLQLANAFIFERNSVIHLIPSLVTNRSVGMMFYSSLCSRCLCSSYRGLSDNICVQVWIAALHGHDMSSGMLKSL
jgi:hypothetical protein